MPYSAERAYLSDIWRATRYFARVALPPIHLPTTRKRAAMSILCEYRLHLCLMPAVIPRPDAQRRLRRPADPPLFSISVFDATTRTADMMSGAVHTCLLTRRLKTNEKKRREITAFRDRLREPGEAQLSFRPLRLAVERLFSPPPLRRRHADFRQSAATMLPALFASHARRSRPPPAAGFQADAAEILRVAEKASRRRFACWLIFSPLMPRHPSSSLFCATAAAAFECDRECCAR